MIYFEFICSPSYLCTFFRQIVCPVHGCGRDVSMQPQGQIWTNGSTEGRHKLDPPPQIIPTLRRTTCGFRHVPLELEAQSLALHVVLWKRKKYNFPKRASTPVWTVPGGSH